MVLTLGLLRYRQVILGSVYSMDLQNQLNFQIYVLSI